MSYSVIAFYILVPIDSPEEEVSKHLQFFSDKDIKGRIYISQQGINAQLSASRGDGEKYLHWLQEDPRFSSVEFKIHPHHEHVFPRTTVKVRKQLVAMDFPVDLANRGQEVSSGEWKEMLQQKDPSTIVIDVRNDYESLIGHFEGAILPSLEQFRHFPDYAQELKNQYDTQDTKVFMYCTGGIRCEFYSALLKQEGFSQVFQLKGGVIQYGLDEGSEGWKGKLFVFDDRLSVPIEEGAGGDVISVCRFCHSPSDLYYNCANMDCNDLFLSCPSCAENGRGCCTKECQEAPRVRAFKPQDKPKPYRRLSSSPEEV